jgi:hypothetical protein
LFDQLEKRLAAVPQTLAPLKFIDDIDRITRQMKKHLLNAKRATALAGAAGSFGGRERGCLRHRWRDSVTS